MRAGVTALVSQWEGSNIMKQRAAKGRCICGACQFSATLIDNTIGICHCSTCRTWGGGPFMSVSCGANVTFTNDGALKVFDSSEWAERGFCGNCGTHLFYRLKEQDQYFVLVGCIDEQDDLVLDHQIFIDEKPDFYSFSNQTHNMTGAEFLAKFAKGS
jgi:hypothetical protein